MHTAPASLEIRPYKAVGSAAPVRHVFVTNQEEWLVGEHKDLSSGVLMAQCVWTVIPTDHSYELVMTVLAETLPFKQLNRQQHIDAWRGYVQSLGDVSLTLMFNNDPATTVVVSAPIKKTRKITIVIWTREHFARHADQARHAKFHFITDPYVDILQRVFPNSTIPAEPNVPLADRFKAGAIEVSRDDASAPEEVYLIGRHADPWRNVAQAYTIPRVD